MNVEVAQLSVPRDGETANGDAAYVHRGGDFVFLAVFDGLGHGAGAEEASRRALAFLDEADLEAEMKTLAVQIGAAVAGTRGAAGTMCRLREAWIEGCGVGNVEMRLERNDLAPILTPGFFGAPVRRYRVFGGSLNGNERILLFSDGMRLPLAFSDVRHLPPADACEQLLLRHRKKEDDATILIADVGG